MKPQTHAVMAIAMTILVCGCNEDESRGASGNGDQSEQKQMNSSRSPSKDSKVDQAINEETAVNIAKEAVKRSPLAGRVPGEARHSVKFTDDRIEVTFLRPVDPNPVPSSGYYAMVWIDAKSGEAIVLGEP